MAELLFQYGANIDTIINIHDGLTLLMQFCSVSIELNPFQSETNLDVVKFLLEHGADQAMKNSKGETAWTLSKNHVHEEQVRKLLKEVKRKYVHPNEKSIIKKTSMLTGLTIEKEGVTCGCFICYK